MNLIISKGLRKNISLSCIQSVYMHAPINYLEKHLKKITVKVIHRHRIQFEFAMRSKHICIWHLFKSDCCYFLLLFFFLLFIYVILK